MPETRQALILRFGQPSRIAGLSDEDQRLLSAALPAIERLVAPTHTTEPSHTGSRGITR